MAERAETCEWGPDDELGAANRMTAESQQAALRRIRHGKVYELGVKVTSDAPAWADRYHKVRVRQLHIGSGRDQMTFLDDFLDVSVGLGTHIDTLAHVAVCGAMYNGKSIDEVFDENGVKCLGMDSVTSFVAPVVVLDMASWFGTRILDGGLCIQVSDIEGASQRQGVSISEGDIVCLHTGWIHYYDGPEKDKEKFLASEPGIGSQTAKYFADKGVIMVAADNWALEVKPKEEGEPESPVHQYLIKQRGVYIGEMFDLRSLVRDQVWTGTIIIQLVRNQGTVQARCNPQVII